MPEKIQIAIEVWNEQITQFVTARQKQGIYQSLGRGMPKMRDEGMDCPLQRAGLSFNKSLWGENP